MALEVPSVDRSTRAAPSSDWEVENSPVSFFTTTSSLRCGSSAELTEYSNLSQLRVSLNPLAFVFFTKKREVG